MKVAIRSKGRASEPWHPILPLDGGIQDTARPIRAQATSLDDWARAPSQGEVFVHSIECQFNAGHSIKEQVNGAESTGRMSDVRR